MGLGFYAFSGRTGGTRFIRFAMKKQLLSRCSHSAPGYHLSHYSVGWVKRNPANYNASQSFHADCYAAYELRVLCTLQPEIRSIYDRTRVQLCRCTCNLSCSSNRFSLYEVVLQVTTSISRGFDRANLRTCRCSS